MLAEWVGVVQISSTVGCTGWSGICRESLQKMAGFDQNSIRREQDWSKIFRKWPGLAGESEGDGRIRENFFRH